MFRRPAPGPQPTWKRPLYLGGSVLLGVIASYGVHVVLEIWVLQRMEPTRIVWTKHLGLGDCPIRFTCGWNCWRLAGRPGVVATGLPLSRE